MSVEMHHSTEKPGIVFSDSAKNHLIAYLAEDPEYTGVRFSVKKTGCSGYSYVVDYVKVPEEEDIVMPLTDIYQVCIAKKSYPYLKNMHIDYVKQGFNYKLIFKNPNETGQCGCGESFTVD